VGEFGLSREIDLTRCSACGLCSAVCPNGVFEVAEPSDTDLLTTIEALLNRKHTLVVGCDAVTDDEGCDLTLPCLGRIDETILVAASAMGAEEIVLNTHACHACEARTARPVIERSIDNSRELLRAFGNEMKIVRLREAPVTSESKGADRGAAEEAPERREFLRLLKGGAFAAAGVITESAIGSVLDVICPQQKEPERGGLGYRVPAKRQVLLSALRRLGKPTRERVSGTSLPFAQVRIDDRCSLCGCCSLLCPTGALTCTTVDATMEIEFSLSRCTGCGVCELACLEGVLSLTDSLETARLVEDGGTTLVSHAAYTCAICHQTFGAPEPKKYCPYCERKGSLLGVGWG